MPKPMFGDNRQRVCTATELLERRQALFAATNTRHFGDGAALRGRDTQARGGDRGLAGSPRRTVTSGWCRATKARGEPGLLAAQSLAAIRISVFANRRREAIGSPLPGSVVQSVPRVCRDDDGRAGRRSESHRSGEPLDKDIYDLSARELKDVPTLPGSLDVALDALEADHEFMLKGRCVH